MFISDFYFFFFNLTLQVNFNLWLTIQYLCGMNVASAMFISTVQPNRL